MSDKDQAVALCQEILRVPERDLETYEVVKAELKGVPAEDLLCRIVVMLTKHQRLDRQRTRLLAHAVTCICNDASWKAEAVIIEGYKQGYFPRRDDVTD